MAWKFSVAGETFVEGDLTLGQAEEVERLTEEMWGALNPLRSAKHAVAIGTVMLAARRDISYDEAGKIVRAESMLRFVVEYGQADDDLPTEYLNGFPPEADAPSTSG